MDGAASGRPAPGTAEYATDDVVQFERVGFARIDAQNDGETVVYYAHA